MTPSRRSFLIGAVSTIITAPAIVRATSLMPVKAMPSADELFVLLQQRMDQAYAATAHSMTETLYGKTGMHMLRRAFVPRLFVQRYEESPLKFNFIGYNVLSK